MSASRRTFAPRTKRGGFRFVLTVSLTTTMIASGGFGTFPANPVTDTFQQVIAENIPADFLVPFNSFMENLSAPTISPEPDSASDDDSPPDLVGFIEGLFSVSAASETPQVNTTAALETAVANAWETQMALPSTGTLVPTQTDVFTPTFTPFATASSLPTWTFPPPPSYPIPTKTAVEEEEPPFTEAVTSTPTRIPINTPTNTVTPPSGFTIGTVTLNNRASPLPVRPGIVVNVSWTFDVFDDQCPTCATQLVTGSSGSHTGTCAFDANADLSPGTAGSETVSLTAPMAYGTYDIVVELHHKAGGCADALAAYGTGAEVVKKTIGTINVQPLLVLYKGTTTTGIIGVRTVADAICAASLPSGYTRSRAFIGYSAADSIANIPANYGFLSSVAIQSPSGKYIADNWVDFMDGALPENLQDLDVVPSSDYVWWSGAEAADGSFVDGVTNNCNDWTSDLDTVGGIIGWATATDSEWMDYFSAGCQQSFALLCIGD